MKQELIFVWLNNHGCLKNVGFNFSPKFSVGFNFETNELSIQRNNNVNIFQNRNILNLSAIIGENGTGKTTVLQFLNSLNCTPLCTVDDKQYLKHTEEQNDRNAYIAVYLVNDTIKIINKTNKTIYWYDKKFTPLSNWDYNHDKLEEMLHAYSDVKVRTQVDSKIYVLQKETNAYLDFLRRQRALIDAEIKRLENGNYD